MLKILRRRAGSSLSMMMGLGLLAASSAWAANNVGVDGESAQQDLPQSDQKQSALEQAVTTSLRTEANVARDIYRNPTETLRFFDVRSDAVVVEIWPGQGWYTEILAPLLADEGTLYAAHFPKQSSSNYFQKSRAAFEQQLADRPEVYPNVQLIDFDPAAAQMAAPAGDADRVLTFRNVHNWLKAGSAKQAFQQFYQMLKPGGVLGVVEHRAKPGTSVEDMMNSGYVTEDKVIELAAQAGFVLEDRAEINANRKDPTVHPSGVWTLPPSLRLGDENREKYLAIGESDRMTLKFRKPE